MNGYGTTPLPTQTGTRLVDDFLRRELRVGDPSSSNEVLQALRQRYQPEAARIERESTGLPLAFGPPLLEPTVLLPAARVAPAEDEATRVAQMLAKDFQVLTDTPGNREWQTELGGWHSALESEFAAAGAAARFAQDPAQRALAFNGIRKLGDFAHVSRLLSLANVEVFFPYRRLGTTLDDAAAAIRMLMGEALYGAGLGEGGFILSVPLTEAREHRDGIVFALRRLVGTEQQDGDWPDAATSYRELRQTLIDRSATELVVYLREEMLVAILDRLLSEASRGDAESLRRLAATSLIDLGRLNELLAVIPVVATAHPSPALSAFEQSIHLFLTAFGRWDLGTPVVRAGARLVDLALPLLLAARQVHEADGVSRRLLRELVNWRYDLSLEAEALLAAGANSAGDLDAQLYLDLTLYHIDRAIDLFAQGQGFGPASWGAEEERAAAWLESGRLALVDARDSLDPALRADINALRLRLLQIQNDAPAVDPVVQNEVNDEIVRSALVWDALVTALAPREEPGNLP